MEKNLIAHKKSDLALGGDVLLPEGFVMPFRLSRSTAGPGAGSASAVFAFSGSRVKKAVSYDSGEFELREADGGLSLYRNGELFLDGITIEPVVYHSPGQAFFNLDQRCIFNCAFCASPKLDKDITKNLTDEKIVAMVRKALDEDLTVDAISLTSGVVGSPENTVNMFVSCIEALSKEFPDIPIGVEPYVSTKEDILKLKEAGATEIKLNVESPNREIFEKVCPELDQDLVMARLKDAVSVFGKGYVQSNVIYGMGETDEDVLSMVEKLSSMGVIPVLRALRFGKISNESLDAAIGDVEPVTTERSMRLTQKQREIMEKYGLSSKDCLTMCNKCGCCDLVPFVDI
ncbi:MAG TPA: radical SAM protein [Candidatus Methanomethylophilaceae archaeon]|nr:radical SAM protein [Candidatus Methanomethylophilaceae archaeon]